MMGLQSKLNEVARTTSGRFSQVDARLQALGSGQFEPRSHESTPEIYVSGLLTPGQLTYEKIFTRVFNFIVGTRDS